MPSVDGETGRRKAESWDFEQAEAREPIKAPRVVVSVAFRHEDFVLISECAERSSKKISGFIREAAIAKATGGGAGMLIYGSGSAGVLWASPPGSAFTRTRGPSVDLETEAATTTA